MPAKRADLHAPRWWPLFASMALHGTLLFLILFGDFSGTIGMVNIGGSALPAFDVGLVSLPNRSGQRTAPQAKKEMFADSSPKQKQQPESAVVPEDAIYLQVERLKKNEQQATRIQQPDRAQAPQQDAAVSGAHKEYGTRRDSDGGIAGQHAVRDDSGAFAYSGTVADNGRPFGFSLGEVSSKPKVVKSVSVVYPMEARKKMITGQVLVRFHLDEKGTVSHLHIKSAHPPDVFDQNTLAALRQWRFQPAIHNKKTVPVWVELPLEFQLR